MERRQRVDNDRRRISLAAHERWKAFQPDLRTVGDAEANLDGTIPRPRIGVITPEQRARFDERQHLRERFESTGYRTLRVTAERMIGATLDFVDLPPDEQALKAGRPVVRLITLAGAGIVPEGFATGFLVGPDLIITNHHVFRTRDEADGVGAQFLYERTHEGLREGLIFKLEPNRFFVNDKGLDYAVVAVATKSSSGAPIDQFQYLPLIAAKGKIRKGDPVNIIQHPEGRPKQYATVNNRLMDLRDDGFLLYETDTLGGSSGSPVFNQYWETIGLHHCGVPQIEDGQLVTRDGKRLPLDAEVADSDLIWVANEGVRVSALVESLGKQRLDRPDHQEMLERFLTTTTDPLRMVAEKSPLIAGPLQVPSVPAKGEDGTVAQNVFQFSGPVTIQVGPASGLPSSTLIANAGMPPAVAIRTTGDEPVFREKMLRFDEDYADRTARGYKENFLQGWHLSHPTTNGDHAGSLLEKDGEAWVIPYYHYSLVMNVDRRLLAWAASNVDYSDEGRKFTKTRKEYGGENWRLDPRVAIQAPGIQLEDAHFYAPAKKIDRGHIVRREDGAWGATADEAEFGNSDTYHWTNCTPQSEAFNQSGKEGIWGQFEEHIQGEVVAEGGRMSVFAGPVLNPDDPEHGYPDGATIQVPMEFWKVVACVSQENGHKVHLAYGFVFDQTEPVQRLGYERMNMDDYVIYQMPLADITKKTGVVFDATLRAADVLKSGGTDERVRGFRGKRIKSLDQIVLR
jgi:endonuclease G